MLVNGYDCRPSEPPDHLAPAGQYYDVPFEDVAHLFHTDREYGLSTSQVRFRVILHLYKGGRKTGSVWR